MEHLIFATENATEKTMDMTTGLQKYLCQRPNSPNWYVRLPVPTHLQSILGKEEIPKSMKTSDRKIAEKRAIEFIAEQRKLFDQLERNQETIFSDDLTSVVVDVYFDLFLSELREKTAQAAAADQLDELHAKRKVTQREWQQLSLANDYRRIEPRAAEFIKKRGYPIKLGSEQFKSILRPMMEAIVEALNVSVKEMETGTQVQPESTLIITAKADRNQFAKQGEKIADYLPKYVAEQIVEHGRNESNLKQTSVVIETFSEWVGRDREIASITKREAAAFRDIVSKLPKGRGVASKFDGLSLVQCAELAERQGLPLLKPSTKNRYMSDLSSFFKWLYQRGVCDTNIWEGKNFKFDKELGRRPAFDTEQLNSLLSSPLYSGFLRDKKEHVPGTEAASDWRHWIPLMCMFTGARITEIAQLYVDDIAEQKGCLIAFIRINRERGQSVKTKTSRLVVFHSTLLSAGLKIFWLEQVKRSKTDGNKQLFPELIATGRPELGTKPAKWFRTYLQRVGIKNGADGLGSHSFRHTLADEMRRAGYTNQEFGHLIMGHADNSMTARYGAIPQGTVDRLSKMIENAKFKGVNFSNILHHDSTQTAPKITTFESVENADG